MSVRVLTRLLKHGKTILHNICRKDFHINNFNIAETINAQSELLQVKNRLIPRNFVLRNVGLQIGQQARRILIDNVLNRVTNSLASDLKKRAAKRILYGDSAPFFALIGVSLASGTGIITKEEELEGVCWEIREAITKIKWNYHDVNIEEMQPEENEIALKDLSIGKPIAKGSNAVVYEASLKQKYEENEEKMPFALKMMFNYDIQSSSMAILKAMYRETVPARLFYSKGENWELDIANEKRHLPPHPNVVAIFSVFTDFVPELDSCKGLFPDALPPRIHADGYGRNMSLFLLMKRYDTSLKRYLENRPSLSTRTSSLLLAQLLEGITHLTSNKIAHRDLKSDNLLIDTTEEDAPLLVISDFGCCLADRLNGLIIPYNSPDVDKGGNAALMAPEIYLQQPGTFSMLNYSKSDLWAAGTISYEIFGMENPFYTNKKKELRNATYMENNLPDLPEDVPLVIRSLIRNILNRNPNKRLDPEIAANVAQLSLWAPSSWLKETRKLPSSAEILQWLLSLTTKVLCEGRLVHQKASQEKCCGRRTYPEYLLISSFLCRASIAKIRSALNWIQYDVYENYP